ncbi:sporulation protein YabP, partial [bacterium]|nr:sporulation protein YabP [bacterium]
MSEPISQEQAALPTRTHTLTMENRSRLTVTGVTRVISCDESGATLQTPMGDLTIGGQEIQVSELSVRTG